MTRDVGKVGNEAQQTGTADNFSIKVIDKAEVNSSTPIQPLLATSKQAVVGESFHGIRIAMIHPCRLPPKYSDVEARIGFVKNELDKAAKLFAKTESESGTVTDKLFVLPEWFFDRPIDKEQYDRGVTRHHNILCNTPRQLPEDIKHELVRVMKKLSREYPGVIIMPGTFIWEKPAERTRLEEYLDRHGAVNASHPKHQELSEKYAEKTHRLKKAAHYIDQVNIEICELNKSAGAQKVRELSSIDTEWLIKEMIPATLIKNTAYAFLNGEILLKKGKMEDGGDICRATPRWKPEIFTPGKPPADKAPLPRGGQVTAQICRDHALGLMGYEGKQSKAGDVHVLESDWVKLNKDSHIFDKGEESTVVVHASTDVAEQGVRVIKNGRLDEVRPTKHDELLIYEVGPECI